jgi:cytochrome c oxidase cbb3-type subunit III
MTPQFRIRAGAIALIGLGLIGCNRLPGRPNVANREVIPSRVTSFDVLYRQNCAGCHGAGGRRGAARPLNDPVYLALVSPERLRKMIGDGISGTSMPAYGPSAGGDLTDAQIDALVKGMLARWARPDVVKGLTLPPYEAQAKVKSPAERERGTAVFARACASCHGPEGKGGPGAGSIVDPTYLALVSDQSIRTTVIAGRSDLSKPDWRNYVPGQPLTPQDVSDLVAWIVGHRKPVPGRPAIAREG